MNVFRKININLVKRIKIEFWRDTYYYWRDAMFRRSFIDYFIKTINNKQILEEVSKHDET